MQSTNRREFIGGLAATTIVLAHHSNVAAQGSDVPLRIIVPASAGSGQDVMVRSAQNVMSKTLGRPVVVENLPGSGGIIGTQQLVKAAPDGNTIAFVSNNHAVNPAVYKKMPYDSLKDITPITVVGETPFLLVVNPNRLPASNAKEMVALIKAKPDYYNFASSGNGTILHLAARDVRRRGGAEGPPYPLQRRRSDDHRPDRGPDRFRRAGRSRRGGAPQGRNLAGGGGDRRHTDTVLREHSDAAGAGNQCDSGRLACRDRTGQARSRRREAPDRCRWAALAASARARQTS